MVVRVRDIYNSALLSAAKRASCSRGGTREVELGKRNLGIEKYGKAEAYHSNAGRLSKISLNMTRFKTKNIRLFRF